MIGLVYLPTKLLTYFTSNNYFLFRKLPMTKNQLMIIPKGIEHAYLSDGRTCYGKWWIQDLNLVNLTFKVVTCLIYCTSECMISNFNNIGLVIFHIYICYIFISYPEIMNSVKFVVFELHLPLTTLHKRIIKFSKSLHESHHGNFTHELSLHFDFVNANNFIPQCNYFQIPPWPIVDLKRNRNVFVINLKVNAQVFGNFKRKYIK